MVRWCRLLAIFIAAFFKPKMLATDSATLAFRVWPQEADKKYMNNASFWTITEMGQMDFLFRTGLYRYCRRYQWSPLVGSQKIVYRRPLKRFERFQLKSSIIFYDQKWVYFEQTFLKDDRLVAKSLVKVLFRGKEGNIPVEKISTVLGIEPKLIQNTLIATSDRLDEALIDLDDKC